MTRLMVDLFSGLGGASEAFVNSPKWMVKRFEINPELKGVPGTTIADVMNIEVDRIQGASLIWASPPCLDFSTAYGAPAPTAKREGREFEPDMTLVEKAIAIIDEVNPQYWVIENVRGAIPVFEDILGKPRQIIHDRWILWGNFPLLCIDPEWKVDKWHKQKIFGTEEMAMNRRSIVPLEISTALLEALETQTTISDWQRGG